MIGEIKDVGTKKNYTVYTEKQIEISGTTGEILKENEIYVTKAKNRDDFIKFFVDNLSFIGSDLLNAERQVLFILLTKIDYKNIIYINSDLRRDIEVLLKVSKSTVSVAINGLKKKGVILSLSDSLKKELGTFSDNAFIINPNIAGRGSFNELQKLRQDISIEYDFEKLEVKQKYNIKSKYDGFDEISNNMENHEIKEIKQTQDKKSTEVCIVEKDQKNIIEIDDIIEQPTHISKSQNIKTDKEIELELVREQNEAKRLDIENLKAKNENLKLQIQLKALDQNNKINQPDFLPQQNDEAF
ncbi:hypothetical protein CCORG_a0003 (plasmid) [Campylobacter corcagiensis]|uniref:Plasmid replication protein RepL domain-containing protein n=1 Tax=Campylobacter corcagiensis TaxID=1448857 RepID=A0A6M8MLA7_9BACT|nr:helix-turn-helix domain-containing protein [Campylobacter corcagiensis]QKF65539.1 hypothetical protein CCORG_a0003 [Campylobacter corcagiensis]